MQTLAHHSLMKKQELIPIVFVLTLVSLVLLSLPADRLVYADSPIDLTIVSIVPNRSIVEEDQFVRWEITVQNQGNGDSQSYLVSMDNDKNPGIYPIHEIRLSKLPGGDTNTITFERPAIRGETLYFMVDSSNEITESDETNNIKTGTPLSDMMLPNLTIDSVSHGNANPSEGEPIEWEITVLNQGPGNSPAFTISIALEEDSEESFKILNGPKLKHDKQWALTFKQVAAKGQTLYFKVDPDNIIEETDETDNMEFIPFTKILPPDLTITKIVPSPKIAEEGQFVRWEITIQNQGSGDSQSYLVSMDNDKNPEALPLHHKQLGPLQAGQDTVVTFEHEAKRDETLYFMVDSSNEITESDETNNIKPGTPLSDIMLPNLTIESVRHNAVNPSEGELIEWEVAVLNEGPGNSPAFTVSIALEEDSEESFEILNGPKLKHDKQWALTFKQVASKGQTLYFKVDPDNIIEETDETDNMYFISFTEILPPDLTITNIMPDPKVVKVGQFVRWEITIQNQGGGDSQSYMVSMDKDKNPEALPLHHKQLGPLQAGQDTVVTFEHPTKPGETLYFMVDSGNEITESDETNNIKSSTGLVEITGLIISTQTPLPSSSTTQPATQTPLPSSPTAQPVVSAPTSIPEATVTPVPECKPGDPCAYIHASKTIVKVNEPITFNLSIVNSISKPSMTAQLLLRIPSGMTLSDHRFLDGCTGQCEVDYDIEPGENRDIEFKLNPNQVGSFNITGKVEWYFKGEKQKIAGGTNVDLVIKVEPEDDPTPIPAIVQTPENSNGGSCNSRLSQQKRQQSGILFEMFGPLLALTIYKGWKKHKNHRGHSYLSTDGKVATRHES